MTNDRRATTNTGLAKVAVQCSASIPKAFWMVKIATLAKPATV